MKVLMQPHLDEIRTEESGIRRVIEAYFKHLPDYGVELVPPKSENYDLKVVHAASGKDCDVLHCHGLYFTADYEGNSWEWAMNHDVVSMARNARQVTVPSEWVAEIFQRDMRFTPAVIGHGIDLEDWTPNFEKKKFALWNKNRMGDVCDPYPVRVLAEAYPDVKFVTTFAHRTELVNIEAIGRIPHAEMKKLLSDCGVYLATTKETFGIGILEAMACGTPVLGFDHGGIKDIIEHGVTGYLAKPGDWDDLIAGFAYCHKYAKILAENALDAVKKFTWEEACKKVARVYEEAMKTEDSSVAVIIPCYNYAGRVGRAIQSALDQSRPVDEIIVVDDGSDDVAETRAVVERFRVADPRVRLVEQSNQGVAHARNNGIRASSSTYACCLDADDALAPEFIERCVSALEKDRTLDIAYTGLHYIKPDGEEGVSPWPGKWDYDAQLNKRNQIPTCCVFRRRMFDLLGGYRQRYAPAGAGSEDAEFWLRAGAYGFKAEQVTREPLFIYSWMSGQVSGNKNYREVDWLAWHPWVKDRQHPFASYATPMHKLSHPVRAYDQPVVSVVIPVGKKHVELLIDALDSLEAQTFRKWEVIVVNDTGKKFPDWISTAYPYARIFKTRKRGTGHARNLGASKARADFLLFLDADDYLVPDALELMLEAWRLDEGIIYSDYIGRAVINDISKLAPDLQKRIYQQNPKTKECFIGYKASDYDCGLAIAQPDMSLGHPYLWANVTCLIPKAWHDEIGGFDESMKSWEDVDYHWRMARAGKCYFKILEELLVYRFHTGMRRQVGLNDWESIVEYLRTKYEKEGEPVCGCKGNGRSTVKRATATGMAPMRLLTREATGDVFVKDEELVMVKYLHPNRGNHVVIGATSKTKYGYRGGGDVFLVRRVDAVAQPHLFEILDTKPKAPEKLARVTAPPVRVA